MSTFLFQDLGIQKLLRCQVGREVLYLLLFRGHARASGPGRQPHALHQVFFVFFGFFWGGPSGLGVSRFSWRGGWAILPFRFLSVSPCQVFSGCSCFMFLAFRRFLVALLHFASCLYKIGKVNAGSPAAIEPGPCRLHSALACPGLPVVHGRRGARAPLRPSPPSSLLPLVPAIGHPPPQPPPPPIDPGRFVSAWLYWRGFLVEKRGNAPPVFPVPFFAQSCSFLAGILFDLGTDRDSLYD